MRVAAKSLVLAGAGMLMVLPGLGQKVVPAGPVPALKDTSVLKPPAGSKVAIVEFEDLECPACARAFPVVHSAVEHYKIPYVRHDWPLPMHVWSFDAAVNARYIQDKISAKGAEDYRRAVFAAQNSIASKDDLGNFTRKFFQSNGVPMPFMMDPGNAMSNEVKADRALAEKTGLTETPSIFVVTAHSWTQVKDPGQLYSVIEQAESQAGSEPGVRSNLRKPVSVQR